MAVPWTKERRAKYEAWMRTSGHHEKLAKLNLGNKYGVGNRNRLGKKHTAASRLKMSERAKARLSLGQVAPSSLESRVAARLERGGFQFEQQFTFEGEPFVWDFAIPSRRVLVEADGCFFHGCEDCGFPGHPSNRRNDAAKDKWARENGWRLFRVKECRVAV